ncbi:putative immunity protein [Actinophytocola algeriensis]|uniref:Imm-5-like domain-containing protein n=1 Tax=Actinophytocola algeriensis TaxID=1768010 RepID=A0A7W7VEQ5_9PSEU|nr:hypothetical protein [Actinophytocola algeriensis]MBB4907364.1 hypothetical protein [Actinophytocola algeriensis]MBE1478847.1 hypothetical protein [Actinophytocola algeriensis]
MDSVPLTDDDRRALVTWAADCAQRVLPLFERRVPDDPRPRAALDGTRAFANGERHRGPLRPLAWAALAAAKETDDPVAYAVARAAAAAVAIPYIHPIATPHQVKHIVGPPLYAARARALAGEDADEEVRWALGHADTTVREVTRRFPRGRHGRTALGSLSAKIEDGLRAPAPAR